MVGRRFWDTIREAGFPWRHPVLWLGVALQAGSTWLLVRAADGWAAAQTEYVAMADTWWWGLPALPFGVAGAAGAAILRQNPRTAQHGLCRTSLLLFFLAGLGAVALLAATALDPDGSTRAADIILYEAVFMMIGNGLLGVAALTTAGTVEAARRKGKVLSRLDLATIPGLVAALIAFGICSGLAVGDVDGRRGGLLRIASTMVGLSPAARPEWLPAAWITVAAFIALFVRTLLLQRQVPDL